MTVTKEEKEYYELCLAIYNELSNTKLHESLSDLRERSITRVARFTDEKMVWKELGKLEIIDDLVNKKKHLYNEIKRLEEVMGNE